MSDYQHSDADAPADDGAREPAWDLTAERSVLGALLYTRSANDPILEEVMGVMDAADFYQPKHELIALAVGACYFRGEPIDPITVGAELERREQIRHAGGAAYLHDLTNDVYTSAYAPTHARIVAELAQRRRLATVATQLGQVAERGGALEDGLEQVRADLDRIARGKKRTVRMVGDSMENVLEFLASQPHYLPTPWQGLDQIIGGFAPGGLYVVAARPGGGKTIALVNIAVGLARPGGGSVAVSSLEMTEQELQLRLLAQMGPVHMGKLRTHSLAEQDWVTVRGAKTALAGAPLFIDDTAGQTLADIRSHARSVARRGNLAAVVVDYLQIVRGEGNSRNEVVGEVAKGLKALAKELDVPVITAAQLKRADKRSKQGPGLDDLRESGDIEQEADAVILISRGQREQKHLVELSVAKNRHGESRAVTLLWEGQYSRFRDRTWIPTALIDDSEMEMAG